MTFFILPFLSASVIWLPLSIEDFHFQLVIFAVLRRARRESDGILAAKKSRDRTEDVGHFAAEAREPGVTAGHIAEGGELVLRLQVADGSPMAVEVQCPRPYRHRRW